MAAVLSTQPDDLSTYHLADANATATVTYNVAGDACTFYVIAIDNTANSTDCYLKVYDVTSGVTVGTTAPHMQFWAPANKFTQYNITLGLQCTAAFSYALVSGSAGTPGTDSPANAAKFYVAVT